MRKLQKLAVIILSLTILSAQAEEEDSSSPQVKAISDYSIITSEFSNQLQKDKLPSHSSVIEQNLQALEATRTTAQNALQLDSSYPITTPMWLPEGFWDGPDKADLGFALLTFTFGEPVKMIFNKVSTSPLEHTIIAPDDPAYRATLATTFAAMMNTLGILMIGGVLISYLIGFFFKRSIEVGYLKGDEKDENLVSLGRGSAAMLGSLPLTPFYGLSSFQVITIAGVLLGLGMASSVIKVGASNFLTPSVVATQYPAVNDFVDNMLWAKVCTMKLQPEFDSKNRNIEGSKGINDSYMYLESIEKSIRPYGYGSDNSRTITISNKREYRFYFGPEAECGSGVIGEIPRTDLNSSNWSNTNDAVMMYTKSVMAGAVLEVLKQTWDSEQFSNLAKNLLEEDYYQQVDSSGSKRLINDAKDYALLKQNQSRYVTGLIHSTLEDLYTSDINQIGSVNDLVEDIANVGMFALGTTYVTLGQLQDSFNDPIEESFSNINDITWMSNAATPWSKTPTMASNLWNYINGNNGGIDMEEMNGYRQRYSMFINSAYARGPSDILTTSITSLKKEGMLEPLNWLAIKVATHTLAFSQDLSLTDKNFLASIADPILTLRNMGRIVQNGILAMYGVTKISEFISSFGSDGGGGPDPADLNESPGLLTLVFYSLFAWGFLMTNLLPNIPYIMWTIASFSYLSFAAMAILGTGWWGGGMTLKGQDPNSIMGRSTEGLNILISLIIRPPLMVVGFFMAIVLNKMLGLLVVSTIEPAIQSASSGITNPLAFAGFLITFSLILTIGIYKNCTLIWEFTDLFMKWIGLDRDHLKQDGSTEAQQQFITSSKGASSQMHGIVSQSIKKGGVPSLA